MMMTWCVAEQRVGSSEESFSDATAVVAVLLVQ